MGALQHTEKQKTFELLTDKITRDITVWQIGSSSVSSSKSSGSGWSSSHGRGGGVSSGRHHGGAGRSHSSGGARQSWLGRAGTSNTATSSSAHSRPCCSHRDTRHSVLVRRRSLHCHRHWNRKSTVSNKLKRPARRTDILPPEEHQAQHSLLLPLDSLRRLWLQLAELLAVAQYDVHVLVESFELTDECPGVLENDPHPRIVKDFNVLISDNLSFKKMPGESLPIIDVVVHLIVLTHNHLAALLFVFWNTRMVYSMKPNWTSQQAPFYSLAYWFAVISWDKIKIWQLILEIMFWVTI